MRPSKEKMASPSTAPSFTGASTLSGRVTVRVTSAPFPFGISTGLQLPAFSSTCSSTPRITSAGISSSAGTSGWKLSKDAKP